MTAESDAQVGSDNDEGEQIESDGTDGVVERLGWRTDGVDEIEGAEARVLVKEQNRRMKDGNT